MHEWRNDNIVSQRKYRIGYDDERAKPTLDYNVDVYNVFFILFF